MSLRYQRVDVIFSQATRRNAVAGPDRARKTTSVPETPRDRLLAALEMYEEGVGAQCAKDGCPPMRQHCPDLETPSSTDHGNTVDFETPSSTDHGDGFSIQGQNWVFATMLSYKANYVFRYLGSCREP